MTRAVLYTGDIFRQQPRGGITRYFIELIRRLERPSLLWAGLHMSEELGGAWMPRARGLRQLGGLANAGLDALLFARAGDAIVHPTYFRDPRALPARAPVVATVFDMTHERFPELFPGRRDPARHKAALCRRAERVVCISEATRRDVIERLDLDPARVSVALLAGRDWGAVAPVPVEGAGERFVLWVGERHVYKNFVLTLQAFAACREAHEVHLLCAGGGAWRAHEQRALDTLGVRARVHQRDCSEGELRWAYERAEALVYTSRWEGFGVPVVEAFELGCAVVASDIAPLREVGGDEAIYVTCTDRDAIGTGLSTALASPREPAAIARRRARAATFSWQRCARCHEAVYRELDP
jgi:glycosyltransferase involved in cell wall biosynthesis